MLCRVVSSLSFLCLFALPARADVWVVDWTGAGDFTDVQAAIDAAADGDTLLLRHANPALYEGFGPIRVVGKGLTIVGNGEVSARVGSMVVRDVPRGSALVLANLEKPMAATWFGQDDPTVGLVLEDCPGSVRIVDCTIEGWTLACCDPDAARGGQDAVQIRRCADVVLARSSLRGGEGWLPQRAGHALFAEDSRVAAYGTFFRGGDAGIAYQICDPGIGGPGGHGATMRASVFRASGCTFIGGDGGDPEYLCNPSTEGGDGGDGVRVTSGGHAVLEECTATGGEGGWTPHIPGLNGEDVRGPATLLAGPARALAAPTLAIEGASVEVTVAGEPGDLAFLLVGTRAASLDRGTQAGWLHVLGVPPGRVALGTVPASGEVSIELQLPPVAANEALGFFVQAVTRDAAGGLHFGETGHWTVLDADVLPPCGGLIHVDVDAAPGGDGSSWASAFDDLTRALGSAGGCVEHPTEVWIAEGTYRPGPPGGSRDSTFEVLSGTHVYGGFEGVETDRAERDPKAHPVVLDGDLNGDDGPGFTMRTDNARHVLRSGRLQDAPARGVHLEGLTVRGGNAGPPYYFGNDGAGMRLFGDFTVAHCTIVDNEAGGGGGLAWSGDRMDLVSCRVVGNRVEYDGGGIRVTTSGVCRIVNTLISGNRAKNGGGGLYSTSVVQLVGCTVVANDAEDFGGGLYLALGTLGEAENCVLWGNTLDGGGAHTEPAQVRGGSVAYSCIQGLDTLTGSGNISSDPLFVDPLGADGVAGTLDDDLHLAAGSPCNDAGSNAALPLDHADVDGDGRRHELLPHDLDGRRRRADDPAAPDTGEGTAPIVDMGAYEHP